MAEDLKLQPDKIGRVIMEKDGETITVWAADAYELAQQGWKPKPPPVSAPVSAPVAAEEEKGEPGAVSSRPKEVHGEEEGPAKKEEEQPVVKRGR